MKATERVGSSGEGSGSPRSLCQVTASMVPLTGKPLRRTEDAHLLTGGGRYGDDVNLPGRAFVCFVRSPHVHAKVGRIQTAPALATPGVVAVLTGQYAAADGVGPLIHGLMPSSRYEMIVRDGDLAFSAPHPPMPADRVRFEGEIVAMVVAET